MNSGNVSRMIIVTFKKDDNKSRCFRLIDAFVRIEIIGEPL